MGNSASEERDPWQKALDDHGPEGFAEAALNYLDEPDVIAELKKRKFDYDSLIFEGGGVKGCAFGGAVRVLSEVGILSKIKRVAGTSAGAFMALQVVLDYSLEEMIIENVIPSFYQFYDSTTYMSFVINILRSYGWQSGHNLIKKIEELIEKKLGKKRVTFRDLYIATGKELCVVIVDVNSRSVVYCHPKTTPYMDVAQAVRTSMSLPLMFSPYMKVENKLQMYYVDGGLLENYPVRVFDGWYLSMKPGDSFFDRLQEDPRLQFEGFNKKSLGVVVFSHGEDQASKQVYLKRLEPDPLKDRPETPLSKERKYTKITRGKSGTNQAELDEAAAELVKFLITKCREADFFVGEWELTMKQFCIAVKEMQNDEGMKKHLITLLGDEMALEPLEETFTEADISGDGRLSMVECLDYLRHRGVYLRYNLESRYPKKITTFTQYAVTMLEVMQMYISDSQRKQEDDERTIGIYTDYVQTADFDINFQDKVYLLKQGYRAAIKLLELQSTPGDAAGDEITPAEE